MSKLQERLDYEESNMFFTCNNPECPRVTFQEAMDNNFECESCKGRLEAFENDQLIKVLKEKIVELEASFILDGGFVFVFGYCK